MVIPTAKKNKRCHSSRAYDHKHTHTHMHTHKHTCTHTRTHAQTQTHTHTHTHTHTQPHTHTNTPQATSNSTHTPAYNSLGLCPCFRSTIAPVAHMSKPKLPLLHEIVKCHLDRGPRPLKACELACEGGLLEPHVGSAEPCGPCFLREAQETWPVRTHPPGISYPFRAQQPGPRHARPHNPTRSHCKPPSQANIADLAISQKDHSSA
jgi:hypothetical protein